MQRFLDGMDVPVLTDADKLAILSEFARIQQSAKDRGEPIDEVSAQSRQDSWKTVQVKASGDRKAYTRRIQVSGITKPIRAMLSRAKAEVNKNVQEGRGSEIDAKPVIEEIAVGAAGFAPGWLAPIASAATRVVTRTWRLSYEDAAKSGVSGLMDGLKRMSKEERQKIVSDGVVELTAGAAGTLAGTKASEFLNLPIQGFNTAGPAAGITAGVSTSKAVDPIAQRIAQRMVKDSEMEGFQQQLANSIAQLTDRSVSSVEVLSISEDGTEVSGLYSSDNTQYSFRFAEVGGTYEFQDGEAIANDKIS